jgi:FixJ family two-component response regulator
MAAEITQKELGVLKLIAEELTSEEIEISLTTVESHRQNNLNI